MQIVDAGQYDSRLELQWQPQLKTVNFNGWQTIINRELGIAPYFSSMLRYRVHHKLACNIIVSGEPGIGKSYTGTSLARVNEGLRADGSDRFTVDQVVFKFQEYMDLILKLKKGKSILFDEPSYAMGKRDWFKEVNKVLVQTIESQRFLVHPLWIPIINQALLDKTIRAYLIQFRVNVVGRGHAIAYRIHASQNSDKIYQYQICELFYRQFDIDECKRLSCLSCKKLNDPEKPCQIFRAQYERKKYFIQHDRYEQARDSAIRKESKEITEDQMIDLIKPFITTLTNKRNRIDVNKLRVFLRDKHQISVTPYKAYNLKGLIETQFSNELGN